MTKLFHLVNVIRNLFTPTYPLLSAITFFLCSLNLVRSFSLKPQNIEIYFLSKVIELQTQFCLPKYFEATPPAEPPKMGSQEIIFLIAQARVIVLYQYRYLSNKCFDIFWGTTPWKPPRIPQMDPPKINFLNSSS